MKLLVRLSLLGFLAVLIGAMPSSRSARAQDRSILVASTTSTQDSGLYGYLLPIVMQSTGVEVKVLAQGTGQALDTARRCDADECSCTPGPPRRNFWQKGTASNAIP